LSQFVAASTFVGLQKRNSNGKRAARKGDSNGERAADIGKSDSNGLTKTA
jgi:hypothetical protein